LASLEVFQNMIDRRADLMLKAFTGLEGGVAAGGSTCGVVTGGAFGLALMHENMLREKGIAAEAEVMDLVGEYVRWFENAYGSALCRERTGVNFYTGMGQLRYLLPGDKVAKCLWHIRGAMRHLHAGHGQNSSGISAETREIYGEPIHCAQAVLKEIRHRTGIGDPFLERLSFIFDGGVGFHGGVCGALAGAILGINLLLGWEIRNISYFKALKGFMVGHINLLSDTPIGGRPEPYFVGKNMIERFRQEAGTLECRNILEKRFSGWDDFQQHISASDKCAGLIEFAAAEASIAIRKLQ
jgi:hypothetical protein